MPHEAKLRPYDHAADKEVIMELWLRAWQATLPRINFIERLEWFRWYWEVKLVPKTSIIVAEIDKIIVGFFTLDLATGYLDQLVVAPEQWGKDVAEQLLNEAKRLSPSGIELRVNSDNPRAARFYEKQNFKKVDELPNPDRPTEFTYVMQWRP
ncbi:MAG: GCN5-related N-acetyltransferase [Candidatus Kaiserbacteria bacterium GW2011_GWB1_52_6]|uniref:GCN5-related N-acetyltransferase n=3 Tax=Candidatus Kaiseribacteriota TaxID=1752734 RepID=A0A0G1XFV3_9BACT|nr:MAG: GCN5-related N-acetyltransferase [Candidatus Kaiserbacteria bacterium GW2011_GWA2_52_12]KKW27743.1 MAG: GCN5-related N-acetyltransferase [Candidatus Kaiserbacteria bacterium GW2011_GWB1_52_6]KKW30118.1 MAG: GCN5-related N-acetyltransferase [Candidatus Kaiserbacteria bacterium GW2011_GWC2_52_8b]